MNKLLNIFVVLGILLCVANAGAECKDTKPEVQEITVKECKIIKPEKDSLLATEINRAFKGDEAKAILDSYRGVMIVTSDNKKAFYRPKGNSLKCPKINSTMMVQVNSSCCDNTLKAPCLLGTDVSEWVNIPSDSPPK